MMINPSIDDLLKKADNKYTLAVLAAKRARQLLDGSEPLVQSESPRVVTIALEEIGQGKITYKRTRDDTIK